MQWLKGGYNLHFDLLYFLHLNFVHVLIICGSQFLANDSWFNPVCRIGDAHNRTAHLMEEVSFNHQFQVFPRETLVGYCERVLLGTVSAVRFYLSCCSSISTSQVWGQPIWLTPKCLQVKSWSFFYCGILEGYFNIFQKIYNLIQGFLIKNLAQ